MDVRALVREGTDALRGRIVFGRPTRIRPLAPGPHAGSYRITSHRLERPDGAVLEGWSSAPAVGPVQGVVLYFGGRNENVVWAPDMASFLPGHAVYAFNYRGFGGSTGWSSERHAAQDAQAVHAYVAAREDLAAFTVMGRSLGTALAIGLASGLAEDVAPDRMVLMSPFESVPHALRARRMGWALAPWIGQRFDSTALARACAGETLVLLAEHDRTIPHVQSLCLCAHLPQPPRIDIVPDTTHRSLPRSAGAQSAIARFLTPESAG